VEAPAERKRRILVVDDDVSSARALAELLQEEGYEPAVAISGDEAMSALAGGAYQLLLVEPSLGDRTGRRLLTYAEELGVPKIVITSDPEFDPERTHRATGSGFLYKPIHLATLLRLVTTALGAEGLA
jgi:DNA-binding NtrC family response regulator